MMMTNVDNSPREDIEADCTQLMFISNYLYGIGLDGMDDPNVYEVTRFPEFFKSLSADIAYIATRIKLAGIGLSSAPSP